LEVRDRALEGNSAHLLFFELCDDVHCCFPFLAATAEEQLEVIRSPDAQRSCNPLCGERLVGVIQETFGVVDASMSQKPGFVLR
jgi:hypothetical protein